MQKPIKEIEIRYAKAKLKQLIANPSLEMIKHVVNAIRRQQAQAQIQTKGAK